jgi:RiboL-PSP-HEPN
VSRSAAIGEHHKNAASRSDRAIRLFFSLFGSEFRSKMTNLNLVNGSEDLPAAVRAFLEIGNERNKLVHRNYAMFALDKTIDEIYALYRKGLTFVEQLSGLIARLRQARGCG